MLERARVPVVVRRLERSATDWDPDFKVPRGKVKYGLPETVRALVRWNAVEYAPTETGMVVNRSGSFSVPTKEKDPGFKLGDKVEYAPTETGMVVNRSGSFSVPTKEKDPGFKLGDKVESIGGVRLDPPVFITGVRPSGLIGGRYRFLRYTFESRPEGV